METTAKSGPAVHQHPTAFARDVVTSCGEPVHGSGGHCWLSGRKHDFGACRFFANGRIWKHCRKCRARQVELVVVGK
jgi:hypothetical protein